MTIALEVRNVHQSFRVGFWLKSFEVLREVSFSISASSVVGLLGANGAGKTTLIHLIAGLRRPTLGEVKVFGANSTSIEARSKLGFLPERPYFQEHLTGEGLLKYYGALSGLSQDEIFSRIPNVLSTVGMSDARKVELRRYSKGMLQRIGIAQALIHDPELLILDEPMSGLDPVGRKEIRDLILNLKSTGKTVLLSSHSVSDVEAICDQAGLIQKGRLVNYGPMDQIHDA